MSARGVLANSIPKAGTYLLKKCLSLLPGLTPADVHLDINLETAYMRRLLAEAPPGAIVTGHLVHRTAYAEMLADEGYRSVLIVRDPRDVAVSFVHYVTRTPEHYLHERYRAMGSDDERLMTTIEGIREPIVPWLEVGLYDIAALYDVFAPWRDVAHNHVVRFEDLVGPAGGGDREVQARTILDLARHLELPLGLSEARAAADAVFDVTSPTFRRGLIGGWKVHFNPRHIRTFREVAGRTLVEWGYENSMNW
ncbi:MAG TPA: hypothetical protein VFF12_02235 [Myxococcaceae bacterium]|nr:hypothetical protein [Myxococcaceae bacterium]